MPLTLGAEATTLVGQGNLDIAPRTPPMTSDRMVRTLDPIGASARMGSVGRTQPSVTPLGSRAVLFSSQGHFCMGRTSCLRLADSLPSAPMPLPGSPTAPPNSKVQLTPAAGADFASRVSNSWCLPSIAGNAISSTFSPNLSGLPDLNALASLGGFDHFNIEQDINDISGSASSGTLPRWTGVDPALGGNTFFQFDDQFPWYYDEVPTAGQWMPLYNNPAIFDFDASGAAVGLDWRDAPNLGPQSAGMTLTFTDYLVGVYADHTGVRISEMFPNAQNVNFTWSFSQGHWGATAPQFIRFARFDQSEPGSDGSIRLLGFFGSDLAQLTASPGNGCKPPTDDKRKQRHFEHQPPL